MADFKIEAPFYSEKFSDCSIVAGKQRVAFKTHQNILCIKSPFFTAAFDGKFKEGVTKQVELLDMEPAVLHTILTCLYGGTSERPQQFLTESCFQEAEKLLESADYLQLLDVKQEIFNGALGLRKTTTMPHELNAEERDMVFKALTIGYNYGCSVDSKYIEHVLKPYMGSLVKSAYTNSASTSDHLKPRIGGIENPNGKLLQQLFASFLGLIRC